MFVKDTDIFEQLTCWLHLSRSNTQSAVGQILAFPVATSFSVVRCFLRFGPLKEEDYDVPEPEQYTPEGKSYKEAPDWDVVTDDIFDLFMEARRNDRSWYDVISNSLLLHPSLNLLRSHEVSVNCGHFPSSHLSTDPSFSQTKISLKLSIPCKFIKTWHQYLKKIKSSRLPSAFPSGSTCRFASLTSSWWSVALVPSSPRQRGNFISGIFNLGKLMGYLQSLI